MDTKQAVKLIKNGERKVPETPAQVELAVDPKKWSTAVHSWVREFQRQRRGESLPPFDSLFK
jgi:hypothetical protein